MRSSCKYGQRVLIAVLQSAKKKLIIDFEIQSTFIYLCEEIKANHKFNHHDTYQQRNNATFQQACPG